MISEPWGDNLPVVVAVVLLDLLVGDPRWFPHPVIWMGRLIAILEKGLRRLVKNEMLGGGLLLALTVSISAGLTFALLNVAYTVSPYMGFAVAVLISWSCLAARSLHGETKLVADAMERGETAEARRCLSFVVGRDTARLEEQEIWRAVVETVAENSSDGVIAPLFYLMIGGPVVAVAYKAINTLDSMVGYRNERYLLFGRASARVDDLANYLPARITGILMVAASPLLGLSGGEAWRIMRRDGRNHSSPNSGIPEAAAAGALGVELGGTSHYGGKPVAKPAIGDPLRHLSRSSWLGAVRLMYGAEALLVMVWLLVSAVLLNAFG